MNCGRASFQFFQHLLQRPDGDDANGQFLIDLHLEKAVNCDIEHAFSVFHINRWGEVYAIRIISVRDLK